MPVAYSETLARQVCYHMLEGKTLEQIGNLQGMPAKTTILRWRFGGKHEAFAEMYDLTRKMQAEDAAMAIVQIADDARETPEGVAKAKLRIETRKWVASRLLRHLYGDNQRVEIDVTDRKLIMNFGPNCLPPKGSDAYIEGHYEEVEPVQLEHADGG